MCEKVFTCKSHLSRHLHNSCKSINLSQETVDIEKLKKKINILETNNNINITNNNTINQNINIIINDFGCEDISHITNEFVKNLIKHMNGNAIVKMIEAVHFKNPYNLNIKLPNEKEQFVMAYKNNKWVINDKSNIIDSLIVKNFDRINDIYEQVEQKLNINTKIKYNDYADLFDKINSNQREEVKKETELLLYKMTPNNIKI
jgi:hypothetical protein